MASSLEVMEAYVAGQARLGYAEFSPGPRSSDVILVSFPKSGSTWTSYLLHLLCSRGDHDFDDIKNVVVDITPGHWDPARNPFLEEQTFQPRTYKTHGSSTLCPKGGKYIYLARDPKDSFISLYHFIHDLFDLEDRVAIDEFYRSYYVDRFATGHDIGNVWDHLLDWSRWKNRSDMFWLHYEDLLEDLPRCLTGLAEFMEVDLDDELLQLIVERSSIDSMRRISSQLNPSPTNYVGKLVLGFGQDTRCYAQRLEFGKMRRGKAGDGTQNLPGEILGELEAEWTRRITPVLGYRTYLEMREDCSYLKNRKGPVGKR